MLEIWSLWKGAAELRPSRNAGACRRTVVITGQVRAKALNMWAENLVIHVLSLARVCHGLDYWFLKCRLIVLQLSYQLWTTLHAMMSVHIKTYLRPLYMVANLFNLGNLFALLPSTPLELKSCSTSTTLWSRLSMASWSLLHQDW